MMERERGAGSSLSQTMTTGTPASAAYTGGTAAYAVLPDGAHETRLIFF